MILISIVYLLLIGSFIYGFNKLRSYSIKNNKAEISFSIIIPFRNEADNLPTLLASIAYLDYPHDQFEIIFVDDNSNDASADLIKASSAKSPLNIRLIPNDRRSDSPKKDAITTAISQAKYEWIITTDADCNLPKYWLQSFNNFIQETDTLYIAAPVTYSIKNTFLMRFQLLDVLSLQGATIGGFGINKPFMCNGANLCYKKSIFKDLQGFKGNDHIAGGDDIFFLEKVAKAYPQQMHYLKCREAIITTTPQMSWQDLISQRIRWAAKTSSYNNWFGKFTGFIVLLMNALAIALLMLTFISVTYVKSLLYVLLIKFSIDFFLIYKTALFFNQKTALRSYFFSFLLYPFFSSYVAVASTFKGYSWKGRTFRK
ncbi:glycosyltransferase family 2 protein [Snuella sedimenti]|uniref:Glycosyltransferase n=1 Tax=Snuella sedimenti TaxID=2798802 RepID=A0A8J7IN56_9FLAO|nr:glycosyltransferase [Snuella sedimenti]MBJ6367752.1 glycosyltransferase [Snuella sedimenti]